MAKAATARRYIRQGGGHSGMVSGIPVDGPVGRVAVTGPHPADDQAEVHPLRRREHSSRTARSSTKQVTCRAAKQKAANAWGYVIRIGDRIFLRSWGHADVACADLCDEESIHLYG